MIFETVSTITKAKSTPMHSLAVCTTIFIFFIANIQHGGDSALIDNKIESFFPFVVGSFDASFCHKVSRKVRCRIRLETLKAIS